jgi:hypothetical protein
MLARPSVEEEEAARILKKSKSNPKASSGDKAEPETPAGEDPGSTGTHEQAKVQTAPQQEPRAPGNAVKKENTQEAIPADLEKQSRPADGPSQNGDAQKVPADISNGRARPEAQPQSPPETGHSLASLGPNRRIQAPQVPQAKSNAEPAIDANTVQVEGDSAPKGTRAPEQAAAQKPVEQARGSEQQASEPDESSAFKPLQDRQHEKPSHADLDKHGECPQNGTTPPETAPKNDVAKDAISSLTQRALMRAEAALATRPVKLEPKNEPTSKGSQSSPSSPLVPRDILLFWSQQRKGRAFPNVSDMDSDSIRRYWPNSILIRCSENQQRLEPILNFAKDGDRPGMAMAGEGPATAPIDISPMMLQWLLDLAKESRESARPIESRDSFPVSNGPSDFKATALPLSADQQKIDHILCHFAAL